jgi:NADPH:quinone reductase-like Zn-dependent oxidoreductase
MKSLRISRFGLEHLALAEVPVPLLAPDQVLVRVRAFSLNYLDLLLVKGVYNPSLPLPHVPGSDAAGVVERVGSAVTGWQAGDEVITHFFVDWQEGPIQPAYFSYRLGSEGEGVFSEYVALPARALVRKPTYLSFAQAATLPIAGLTAWVSLLEEARVTPGQTVLVQGTGGVALFALQLARLAGASVIATQPYYPESSPALGPGGRPRDLTRATFRVGTSRC